MWLYDAGDGHEQSIFRNAIIATWKPSKAVLSTTKGACYIRTNFARKGRFQRNRDEITLVRNFVRLVTNNVAIEGQTS